MKKRIVRVVSGVAVLALALGLGTSGQGSSTEAAGWQKHNYVATSCYGYWPVAGYLSMLNHDGANSCKSNWTTTNSDNDLRNDTWSNGAPMAPGIEIIDPHVYSGDSVTLWRSTGCQGQEKTVNAYLITSLNWYSYKRNSSSNGC